MFNMILQKPFVLRVMLSVFLVGTCLPGTFAQSLTLTPNECFFSPDGTLRLFGKQVVTDPYNNNVHYERIGNWKRTTDTIVWGLKNVQPGSLNIALVAGIADAENNQWVAIYVDDQEKDIQVSATNGLQDFQFQGSVSFEITEPGTHEIKVRIKTHATTSNFGEIERLELSGSALDGAEVWRRRWRPAAIHAKFLSNNDVNTEITVYEMTIPHSAYWSYQVMTTEFGYVGAPIQDSTFSELNFSLWSYGANDPEPPHDELSHLIAVGGPGNYFGQYGHEGTGVKPRGFNPYEGIRTATYTLAVRKQPGEKYNTFWCYYLDPHTRHWKLYGCGKKLNTDNPPRYMKTTGGFVEVVGAPDVGRTGHRQRAVEYRGWRMQHDGTWNVIDRIDPAYNSDAAISYKEWTTNSEGNRFVMKMGGFLDSPADPGIIRLSDPSPLPDYLQGEYVEELYRMPAEFRVIKPQYLNDSSVIIRYVMEDLGNNPEITLYYGTKYGLTEGIFADKEIDPYWEDMVSVPLSAVDNDTLRVQLDHLSPDVDYYYRLRVKNDEGITWAFDTDTFNLGVLSGTGPGLQEYQDVEIYPNPVKDVVVIRRPDDLPLGELEILNSTGMRLYHARCLSSLFEFDMRNLPAGIYFVTVRSGHSRPVVRKLIKK